MDKLEKISGEDGFYKIRKVKILYEINYFEKHFIIHKIPPSSAVSCHHKAILRFKPVYSSK